MKKMSILICSLMAICALIFTACGDNPSVETPTTAPTTETHTHTEVTDEAVAPTCTETGLTEGKHCSVCKEVLAKQEVVEASHTWSTEYQGDKQTHWLYCMVCGQVEQKNAHNVGTGEYCSVCDMPLTATEGIIYDLSEDGTYAGVVGYTGAAIRIRIAEEYQGVPVTHIGLGQFETFSGKNIISVIIPDSVTTIGDNAFKNCSRLTNVTIPDSVTTIGVDAFYGCSSLESVIIGNGVTTIDERAFSHCSNLQYTEYGNCKYLGNAGNPYLALITFTDNSYSNYTIHNDTKVIAGVAFYKCANMATITIPDSVTTIGNYAFYGCSSLTSVTIPDSVTTIGEFMFYGCSSLTSVTIPDGVTTIGVDAFYGCSSLTSVTIPDSVTAIDFYAFYGCSSLESVTIGNGITTIGDYAFSNCSSLQYTEYGNCKYLGNAGNPYLALITVVDNSYSSYTIHNDTKIIADSAFYKCANMTTITIPDSVTTIGNDAFSYCSSLTSVTIPDSVTAIGNDAFGNCYSLTEIRYGGTKEQWKAIEKGCEWNSNAQSHFVYCTDGKLEN